MQESHKLVQNTTMTQLPPRPSTHRDAYPEDEDYVGYAITQLRHAHFRTQEARAHGQSAQAQSSARLGAALEGEKAMMGDFEDYLREALLWQEKQTGQARLAHALGTLQLQDAPPRLMLRDLHQLQAWVRHFQQELLTLGLALPEADATDPTSATQAAWQTAEATQAALRTFYEHTGVVPPGSQLEPRQRVVVLD